MDPSSIVEEVSVRKNGSRIIRACPECWGGIVAALVFWGLWGLGVVSLGESAAASEFSPVSTAPAPLQTIEPVANSPFVGEDVENKIAQILADAAELTEAKKWSEAKACYENGLRQFPEHPVLTPLYRAARAHTEVLTRYQDSTFCEFLAQTDRDEMTRLCDDVLDDIRSWHVDIPAWNELFASGMESFGIALTEKAFLDQNRVPATHREKLPAYAGDLIGYSKNWRFETREQLRDGMFRIAETVQQNTGISGVSVLMELLAGMVNSLDTYSAWLTCRQINDIYSMIDGHFVGLGVYIEPNEESGSLLITRVIAGSPAAESGLATGDQILAVDHRPVADPDTMQPTASLLQGPEGSRAELLIKSPEAALRTVTVVRRAFDFPSVEETRVVVTPCGVKTGYFRINTFQKTTVDEVRRELMRLHAEPVHSLVIDLRNNPGGLLDKAIELSNLFLDHGTIVRTRGQKSERTEVADARECSPVGLILLLDENSASAAEIFAGAIQENGRGFVIGQRSYGKGTIQAILQVGSLRRAEMVAGLRLTTEKFYSPSGRSYCGVGVIPDIPIGERTVVARPNSPSPFQNVSQERVVEKTENADSTEDLYLATAMEEIDRRAGREQLGQQPGGQPNRHPLQQPDRVRTASESIPTR